MSAARLLADLLAAGVQLWAVGEEVRFRAPRGVFTPELRQRLAAGKADVVALLGQHLKYAVCSFAQQRLWFIDQLAPGNAAYNTPDAVRLVGDLDVAALAACFDRIVCRHEVLRTRFRDLEGRPAQVIMPAVDAGLRSVDLSALPPRFRSVELRRLIGGEALRPFDLARGPLLRLTLFRLAPREHVLLINLHHIVSDGWSQGVLFRELAALYAAAVDGRPDPLPALPGQYADHAVRQRRQLAGEMLETQLGYWRERLAGLHATGLPTDRPRPARQTYRGAMRLVELPAGLNTALKELGQQAGTSLFMTLLAAFMALLHRTVDTRDVAVGSPIAQRTRDEIESLIGFFVNTLVMRGDLSGEPTFRELLGRVRVLALAAYDHQDLPFEKLVEELQPRRDMSRNPFFQLTLALQNAPRSRVRLPGLTLSRMEFDRHAVRLDLEVFLWEVQPSGVGDPHLAGKIFYNADLFDATTVQRLAKRFSRLLHQVTAAPERRLVDLPLAGAAERHQLLMEWSPPEPPRSVPVRGVQQMFEAWVERQPHAVAVISEAGDGRHQPGVGARGWTYRELNRRANQLAHRLRELGVGPEELVGVCLERSPEAILTILAVLKAGGAYLPLDPVNPEARLRSMLADVRLRVIVTREGLDATLMRANPGGRVLCLDREAGSLGRRSDRNLTVTVESRHLAYAIFTSGSTGRPKGSALAHGGLTNLVIRYGAELGIGPRHRVSLLAASGFDASVWELWSHLAAGASLHLPPIDTELFPAELAGWLTRRRISHCFLPTPLAEAFLAWPGLADRPPLTLRSLQVGGDRLRRRPPSAVLFKLVNLYGPTEATVVTVYGRVRPGGGGEGRPIAIGRPVGGCQALILDRRQRPALVGTPGELHLAGVALGRGYLGLPAATAEAFGPHPSAGRPGVRLYRTGDRARQRGDGVIECLGRLDRQLKIRGLRVEPGEIEALLAHHPLVREAAVVSPLDDAGTPRLVAFVVPEPARGDAAATALIPRLRDDLRLLLPRPMVPAVWNEVETLPLSANGKLDRAALARLPLPDDPGTPVAGAAAAAAPATADEELLAGIWQEILGRESVGTDDNFFDLGGHSLLATQVVSRIRQVLGIEVPLRRLFEHPTVRGLAAAMAGRQRSGTSYVSSAGGTPHAGPASRVLAEGAAVENFPPPPLVPGQRPAEPPLSFAQQRLWFLSQLDPDHSVYHIAVAFQLEGDLDHRALARALAYIVERHEALRTTFPSTDGRPVQCVAPPSGLRLPLLDLDGLAPERRRAEARAVTRASARRAFDLAHGPLFRVALLRLSPGEHMLLLEQHHIISDGWSQGVFYRELQALYAGFAGGRSITLPQLAVQYADFAIWQRDWLRGPALAARLEFWRRQLADCPALALPTDRPRPEHPTYRGASLPLGLAQDLVDPLRRLGVDAGASLFMTLLTAFATLLGRISGQDDIVLGSPIANRSPREVEDLIGFFVNSLVLRVDLTADSSSAPQGGASFETLLKRVREITLEAYAHQDLPFEKLVEELQPTRDASRNPLFQVWLALQNAPRSRAELKGLTLTRLETESDRVRFDLELHLWHVGEGLDGALLYNTDLFDPSTIMRWERYLQALVRGIAEDPRRRLGRLPLLSAGEQHQLVVEWNDSETADVPHRALHELIAERALKVPEAVAVVLDDPRPSASCSTLSYRQLEMRAEGLAEGLRAAGAGPESFVGLAAERSLEMVVGLLAVLKCGAAYLPLDPSYPRERLAFMLRDSRIPILLLEEQLRSFLPLDERSDLVVIPLATSPSEHPAMPAGRAPGGDGAAYMIYTSGSTGRPKGVVNSHRGIVNRLRWMQATYRLTAGDAVAQKTPLSFDVSVWEVFWPLIVGARLVLARPDGHRDAAYLADLIVRQGVTTAHFVPSMLGAFLDQPEASRCQSLRWVIASGEALPRTMAHRWRSLLEAGLHNLYGPTEAAIDVTYHPYQGAGSHDSVAIGRPVAGTDIHLLDSHLEPVPIGLAGELHIAGVQLARGYNRRPGLTAERFIPDPLGGAAGGRLYRTGDLVRRRRGGELVFLSRLDDQVKIRGVRVEPGEIEEVLRRHPEVRDAAVVAQVGPSTASGRGPGTAREARLVAYLAHDGGGGGEAAAAWQREHAERWREVYDDLYAQERAPQEPDLDTVGWNSSITGTAIPQAEMQEWVEGAVARILATRPRRLLEIGCGTGLILERVARHCQQVTGSDFSQRAVDDLKTRLAERSGVGHVRLECRAAHDFIGVAAGAFDTVVLNSVVQYFPGVDYLLDVLRGAVAATAPGGAIFIGDVRSLPLLDAFCASVELHAAAGSCTQGELADRIRQRRWREQELVIDPTFFHVLSEEIPRLVGVLIEPKGGRSRNELTQFRYDVTLRLDTVPRTASEERVWLDWRREGWTLSALRRYLVERSPTALGLRRVPNARLGREVRLLGALASPERRAETVAELETVLAQPDLGATEPAEFEALAHELGSEVRISWGAAWPEGAYDVIFGRSADATLAEIPRPAAAPGLALSAYANNPLRDRWAERLVPAVREHARRCLPENMVPAAYVVLDALPLTPSGKVDRGALRRHLPPTVPVSGDGAYVAPRNDVEELLAGIWCRLLDRDRVGIHDNFFELGGHSLLATQVMSRLREAYQVEIPVRRLFDQPTIARLAVSLLDARRGSDSLVAPPIEGVSRDARLPLSFAQQRLWFLHQLEPDSVAYHMPAVFRLSGPLHTAALSASLRELVRRHESLRTVIADVEGGPWQHVRGTGHATGRRTGGLPVVDLERLSADRRRQEASEQVRGEALRPFDLARGPLFRTLLVRLAADHHLILLCCHHIVSDGWSQGILQREWSVLYRAFMSGRPSPLPELPVQYADFAVWQRRWFTGEVLAAQLAYWQARLAHPPAPLELPTDRPRPKVQTTRGGHRRLVIPAPLTGNLERVSHEAGASLYMTLLAALMALLHRCTGQHDIAVGSPIANRNREETEGLVGFFVNTLVMRGDLSGDPSFRRCLGQVRGTALEAYAHQDLPFERLVEELQSERDLSRPPLFQVMLTLHNAPSRPPRLAGLAVEAAGSGMHPSKFDLELSLGTADRGGGLDGVLAYNADLFDSVTMQRLEGSFRRLLNNVARDPDTALSVLQLLGRAERQALLVEGNDTRGQLDGRQRLHHLFDQQVEGSPDAVALICGTRHWTYRQLEASSNRLAHHLVHAGIGTEDRVGVCLPRSADAVISILAVLKAGAAYLPLDPEHPAERLAGMLRDSRVSAWVTRWRLFDGPGNATLRAVEPRVICLDTDHSRIACHPVAHPAVATVPGQAAYVMYTSGSSGEPKGVVGSHRATVNRLRWMWHTLPFDSGEVCCQKTPLAFVDSVWEIFGPLLRGVPAVLMASREVQDPHALVATFWATRVTRVVVVPSLLRLLLETERPSEDAAVAEDGCPLPYLRVCVASGEVLTNDLAERFAEHFPGARLLNLYGSTEVAADATWQPISSSLPVTVGRPIANCRIFGLDRRMWPAATGIPGELHVGGEGLARGYLYRPRLTAQAFVPDPWSQLPGARLYRTGDRVRRLGDGQIDFLGRIDQQVKIRGVRIEPGEITVALARHPAVDEAAVVLREGSDGGSGGQLIAYYKPAAPAPVPSTLRTFLRRRFPEVMIPAFCVPLASLPKTVSGKIDRVALSRLPRLEHALTPAATDVAPRTPGEDILATIWGEVLELESVGVHDNFFDLGGHSLLATRVVSRIRRAFALEPPIRLLFEQSTVAKLAAALEALRRDRLGGTEAAGGSDQEAVALGIPPAAGNGDGMLPLSFGQERLWFLTQLEPDVAWYNLPLPLRLRGPLNLGALRATLGEIVRRHAPLRTCFDHRDGRAIQRIAADGEVTMPLVDLTRLAVGHRTAEARRQIRAEARRLFDLERDVPLRVTLLRTHRRDHSLLVTFHHIAADGWSLQLFRRELGAIYEALSQGRPSPLPPLPVQYVDFASWQRRRLTEAKYRDHRAYWTKHLAPPLPALELPTDRPRPEVRRHVGATVPWRLPASSSAPMKALCRSESASPFMVLMAGFMAWIHRVTGCDDIVVGTPIAGRIHASTEPLIGYFINTLALRERLAPGDSFRALVGSVRGTALDAYAFQDLPFEKLIEMLEVDRDLSRHPMFQVSLALQNVPRADTRAGDLEVSSIAIDAHTVRLDVQSYMWETAQGFAGHLLYDTSLFDASTAARMSQQLQTLITTALDRPAMGLQDLGWLSRAQRHQLLVERSPPSAGRARAVRRDADSEVQMLARSVLLPRPAAEPYTPWEQALAEIWRDVLGVDALGIDDDFFALGGHSLLALRLIARIDQRLGVRLPLASLFRGATVREQAVQLLALQDEEPLPVPPDVRRPRSNPSMEEDHAS